jgi:hypothetical protein
MLMASQFACEAQGIIVSTVTTAELVGICNRTNDPLNMDFCVGYILGAYDQMSLSRSICPRGGGSGTAQALAVARKFLNEHPERWHLHPSFLLADVFRGTFPCTVAR